MLLANPRGGYSFLRGISPYSGGVAASPGFAIVFARLSQIMPWRDGFELVDAVLSAAGRPRAALCAMALRSPAPFTFDGFKEFNAGYVAVLKSWEIFVDGINPVARTNVAPRVDPPAEASLYSFAYTVPAADAPPSFVVAGAGELPEGSLYPTDVIRRDDTSPEALAEKTSFVLGLMEGRMNGLGTLVGARLYDQRVHRPRRERAARAGNSAAHRKRRRARRDVHHTHPPIVSIEYEMDVRGGTRDIVIPRS